MLKALLLVLLAIAVLQGYLSVTSSSIPLGVDWNNFHSQAVLAYSKGDFSWIFSYPPAFELMFVPLAWLNLLDYAYWIQLVVYVLAIMIPTYFVYKVEGLKVSFVVGFILLLSLGYMDRAIQLAPATLELSLFPLAVLLFLDGRIKIGSAILLFLSYSHPLGFVYSVILLAYFYIVKGSQLKASFIAFILSIPSMFYILGVKSTEQYTTIANSSFLASHLDAFITYTGAISFVLLPFFIVWLLRKRIEKKDYLYLIWFIAFTPLAFLLLDRWIQYILLPLSILETKAVFDLWFCRVNGDLN